MRDTTALPPLTTLPPHVDAVPGSPGRKRTATDAASAADCLHTAKRAKTCEVSQLGLALAAPAAVGEARTSLNLTLESYLDTLEPQARQEVVKAVCSLPINAASSAQARQEVVKAVMPVRQLHGGTHSRVLAVSTGQGTWILRHTPGICAEQQTDLLESFEIMKQAAQVGLAPALWYLSPTGGVSIQAPAPGVRLDDFVRCHGNPSLALLGGAVARLHAQPARTSRKIDLDARILRTMKRNDRCDVVYPPSYDACKSKIAQASRCSAVDECDYTLSHSDLNPTNVFVDGRGGLCFIDWDFSGKAHPYDDLAIFSFHLELNYAEERTLLECYLGQPAAADQVARLYLRRLMMTFLMGTWAMQQPYLRPNMGFDSPVTPSKLHVQLAASDASHGGVYGVDGEPTDAAGFTALGLMRLKKLMLELGSREFEYACELADSAHVAAIERTETRQPASSSG